MIEVEAQEVKQNWPAACDDAINPENLPERLFARDVGVELFERGWAAAL